MTWILIVVVVLVMVLAIWQTIQLGQIRRKVQAVPADGNVFHTLNALGGRVRRVEEQIADLEPRQRILEERLPHAISHTGVVTYDAFGNIAGHLSRSIAMLSDVGDGLVITVLVAREETIFYAKRVTSGQGEEVLSPEELAAVDQALAR